MKILKTRNTVLLLLMLFSAFNISYAEECETIRFKPGESSGTVSGLAPVDDIKCYQMTTAQGQTATVQVIAGKNIIFAIPGVIDGQDSHTFITDKKTYRIEVGQLMRAIQNEAFTLFISIK